MKRIIALALGAFSLAVVPTSGSAEGNLASRPTTITLDINGIDLTFSTTEYEVETGKYYKWEITSDGFEELMIQAPDLFRNSWINQIVIDEREVHTTSFYGIEFDDEGTVAIFFVPIRPGNYAFFAPGFERMGLSGTFIVR